MSDITAIPLRKKYYNGEQVIKAVSKHVDDHKTLMAIFNSFAEMDGADIDDSDAYNLGFRDGVNYAIQKQKYYILTALKE